MSVSDEVYTPAVVNYNIRGGLIYKLLLSINVQRLKPTRTTNNAVVVEVVIEGTGVVEGVRGTTCAVFARYSIHFEASASFLQSDKGKE